MMINIHDFSKFILTQKVYKDRVVVLCEGKITGSYADLNLQQSGRRFTRSVKAAKQHDAHFYDKCKPDWWKTSGIKYPEFINAGSRSQAIETFFTLIDLHNQNPQTSYLNPAKLFALVDLDIQSQTLTTDQAYQPYNTFQEIEDLAVGMVKAEGRKCDRCWNYSVYVGQFSNYPDLCERCVPIVDRLGVDR